MAQSSDIEKVKNIASIFVVFGATGDLARKKIFPSFFTLSKNNLLPSKFKIIAAARTDHSKESFQKLLEETIPTKDKTAWQKFANLVDYFQCDLAQNLNLDRLTQKIDSFEKEAHSCAQRIYYLAIDPAIYQQAFENLGINELNKGCKIHNLASRIVTEKPFGYDFASAQSLNEKLSEYFDEEQIFRIDHFLGKETVQNIFAFRFGNEIFEPVWNKNYVDNIQITLAEHIGIEKRGQYYNKAGALRDVVQNHLLQLLTLVTMETPAAFDHLSIRKKRLEILNAIKPMSENDVLTSTTRGQYEGYLDEEKIDASSKTETYALVKLFIENERWQDVPIYLRTGKKLMGKVSSIIISFKEKGHKVLENFWEQPLPNHVTLQIEPNEGIGITLVAKKPGLTTQLEHVNMEFCYRTSFDTPQPSAYERLLLDIIIGDRTLFLGKIGASWKIIDPIRKVWDSNKVALQIYKPGTWGPEEADKLIKKDGREWLSPLLTICKI